MVSDGITVEAFLYENEKSRKRFFMPTAMRILISFAGTLGTVFSFLTCFEIGIDMKVVAAAAALAVIIFGTALNLRGRLILPVFSSIFAVYAAILFKLREAFCNGLANMVNIYLGRVKSEFAEKAFLELLYPETAAKDTQTFFILTACIIAMCFAYGTAYKYGAPFAILPSAIVVEMCLYFGLVPNYIAFIAVLAAWFAMFAINLSMPEGSNVGGSASAQCGFAAAAAAFLCALLAFTIIHFSNYSRPQRLDEIRTDVSDYLNENPVKNLAYEIKLTDMMRKTGAVNHGKLGENGNITFSNKTILTVTMPKTADTVYLKGFIGSVYTGKSWEELSSDSLYELEQINGNFTTNGMNSLLLSSYNLKMSGTSLPEYSFSVTNVSAGNEYLYMPYNLVPESVSRYEISDDTFVSQGEKNWFGRIYDPSSLYSYRILLSSDWVIHSSSLAEDQDAYRSFVYENYLDVPDSFTAADEVFTDEYYDFITHEYESTLSEKSSLTNAVVFGRKLYYIKSWLRDNCSYNLEVGKLPSGKDFADYFITETREGSCSHFATAAVLLCRYAGIPARYVEGYVIKPSDFNSEDSFGSLSTVDVTDARAHAWAEVYIDGYGWYPMEFTSGYGNIVTAVTTAPQEEPESEVSDYFEESDVSAEISYTTTENVDTVQNPNVNAEDNSVTTIPTQIMDTSMVSSETSSERGSDSSIAIGFSVFGRNDGAKVDVVYDLTWLIIIVSIIATMSVFLGIRRIIIVKQSHISPNMDVHSSAKRIYRRFRRFIKAIGLPDGNGMSYEDYISYIERKSIFLSDKRAETIIQTALKAEFGGESVTRDEIIEMNSALDNASKRYLKSLNSPKRFYARFIKGIVG